MKIKKLYKFGKKKALTLSYDDGIRQDIRFVEMLNKYGIKCTFNLNSALSRKEDVFTCADVTVVRTHPDLLPELYEGHEVAMHMCTHPWPTRISDEELKREVLEDRKCHEEMFGYKVDGMAYPFGDYNDRVIEVLAECGVKYARTIVSTSEFTLPERWLAWHATCHHIDKNFSELTDKFLGCENELALFYLWGHSYEFDVDRNWDMMEDFCKKISGRDDIYYATNMEIYDYINAMNSLVIEGNSLHNPSNISLWVELDGDVREIKAGEKLEF